MSDIEQHCVSLIIKRIVGCDDDKAIEAAAMIDRYYTAPGETTKSDVEALAATTAERPGTVTSEPESSTSDPSSTRSDVTVPCDLDRPSYHDCKNMKEVSGGMDGERYRCNVCGNGYYLDYDDMR